MPAALSTYSIQHSSADCTVGVLGGLLHVLVHQAATCVHADVCQLVPLLEQSTSSAKLFLHGVTFICNHNEKLLNVH